MPLQDRYHLDYSRDSNSSLNLFRDSIEEYAALRVHKVISPRPATPEMVFGSAFHCYLLEPQLFEARYLMEPQYVNWRTKEGRALWAELESTGKDILTKEQWDRLPAMRDGVMRNRFARRAMESDGECEKVVTWEDQETGAPLKLRADKILPMGGGMIVDIKTTQDVAPSAWTKTVVNLRYDTQGTLYLDGGRTAGLSGPFLWFAVNKNPPHETVVYAMDDLFLARGQAHNRLTLEELVTRRSRGDWSGRWSGNVQSVSPPKWAM